MPLPTITGIARLVADPELRFTSSGKAVASIRLAFNSRRLNAQTQQWEDGDTFWVRGSAWEQMAENCAETLAKGMEVLVSGELKTQSWEKDGVKRDSAELAIRSIGPSLAYATAQVTKSTSGGTQGQQGAQQGQRPQQTQQRQQTPQDDPWATAAPAAGRPAAGQGNAASNWGNDQPPF